MKKMVNGDDEISEDALEERQIINEDDPRVNVSSRKIHCLMSVFQIELRVLQHQLKIGCLQMFSLTK